MTTKDDFTVEEWTQLQTAPVYAGMGIITADPAVTSIFKESAAMAKAMGVDTTNMTVLQASDKWFEEIEKLLKDLEITPGQLNKQFGLQEKDLDHMIKIYANDFCSQGNPKEFNAEEVRSLLKSVL